VRHTPKGRFLFRSLIVVVALFVIGSGGCSDETDNGTGPGDGTLQLVVESIILNPKSPAPGDTLLATAVVVVRKNADTDTLIAGDFASYDWSADGGQFLETTLSTVRWVAPDTSTMFTISVTVSHSVGTASASRNMFVSRILPVRESGAGPMTINPTGNTIVYLSSVFLPTDMQFNGFDVSSLDVGTGSSSLSITAVGQTQYRFSQDLALAAYVVPGVSAGLRTLQYRALAGGAATDIPHRFFTQRAPQFTEPYFLPDKTLLTYQIFLPDLIAPPSQGGVDTFVVATWDLATETETRVAVELGTNNFHPTFSTDGAKLVYVSDRSGNQQWELYALAVAGGMVTPDTASAPLQLTQTGGLMGSSTTVPVDRPKAWNPVDPILATLDEDGKMRLVPTDGSGSILVNVAGEVREFIWSPSGQDLLMTTGDRIYRVDKAGGAVEIHRADSGDNISRLSWSDDERYLVYVIRRLADTWYELIDLGGSLGISAPLRVTPSGPLGVADIYSGFAPIRPVWLPGEPVAYLLFFDSNATPGIYKMNFGGLSP